MKLKEIFYPKLLTTLKDYNKSQFINDLSAGVIVGIVALPLAIAFAIASGVTPEKGLITAIIAGFIISVFGGSRDGGFKRKEFDGERKSFDRPKQDNFKDGDFENSGSYSKEYNKSSERSSERKFGDKPNYSKGDRKDSKFSSKSGGKFGSPKFGGSKSGGKKFVKRTGGSKGR